MSKENLIFLAEQFQKAAIAHTLLLIFDSKSHAEIAHFKVVSYYKADDKDVPMYLDYEGLFKHLGFKQYKDGSFRYDCAGRFSLYVMEGIVNALERAGFTLLDGIHDVIGNQHHA